jgi:hypothetical protein
MGIEGHIELVDHTGDVGVRVRAADLPQLFALAARAMFQIICPECVVGRRITARSPWKAMTWRSSS